MFLKSLTITSGAKVIREIEFHKGLNLIVDESENQITGNSVGKTTVLKLVDFCLGANPKHIYVDHETRKQEYKLVKDFLIDNKVLITLVLTSDLDQLSDDIVIERNFLARREIIRKINGIELTEDEFESKLSSLIFPEHIASKPTFRQIISHNIRYKDESVNNTLKTLDTYTSDAEYETLYLFLFGCEFTKGNSKQEILTKIRQEDTYKTRLEKNQTKTAYETALSLINNDIEALNRRKSSFNLNENLESDLDKLNKVKESLSKAQEKYQEELDYETSDKALKDAKEKIVQIKKKIENKEITFADAARAESDEKETKTNGGVLINPKTQDTHFELTKMDPTLYSQVSNLKF